MLKQDDLRKGLHPTDEELKAFYEGHKTTYANSIPEKRKVKYAVVDTAKAEAGVQVTPDDLRAYYDQHRDQYRTPDQVKVSHILIKTPLPGPDGKVDEKGAAEAQRRAEDLLKQLKAGAKLEDLAKKYSEDPGSAKQGGSLGWIGKGQTVPEFEKAAFSLPKGQISDLVKSSYGFHIIRVDDKQDAHVKIARRSEGRNRADPETSESAANRAKKGRRLVEASPRQGSRRRCSNPGDSSHQFGLLRPQRHAAGPWTRTAVHGRGIRCNREVSADMAPASQGIAVYQLLGIKLRFDTDLRRNPQQGRRRIQKRAAPTLLLSQKIQELSDRAKAEHDLKRAAKELGATFKTSDLVLPDGQVPEVGSMSGQAAVAFNMKPGEISGPINSGTDCSCAPVDEKPAAVRGGFCRQARSDSRSCSG